MLSEERLNEIFNDFDEKLIQKAADEWLLTHDDLDGFNFWATEELSKSDIYDLLREIVKEMR